MSDSTTGLLINHRNVINASNYATGNVELVGKEDYMDSDAIQCSEPDMEMVRIQFPPFELAGWSIIKIFYDSDSETRKNLLNVKIYANDDVLVGDINCLSSMSQHRTLIAAEFYPQNSYEIVISTGPDLTTETVTLDYIQLDAVLDTSTLENCREGSFHPMAERGTVDITGDGTSVKTENITFSTPFASPPQVFLQTESSYLNAGASGVTTDGCIISMRHINATIWSSTETCHYYAIGNINSITKIGFIGEV